MAVAWQVRRHEDVGAEVGKHLAHPAATDEFQIQAVGFGVACIVLHPLHMLLAIAGSHISADQEFDVLTDQFLELAPDFVRTLRQRQLLEMPPLPAHVAEVDAAGLLADQAALEQDHGHPALAQKEGGGGTHEAATDDDDICFMHAHSFSSRTAIASGLIGACPRKRPTCSTGTPAACAMTSAPACPQ